MTFCPTCAHDWPRNSMSAIAVELIGGCLWCKFGRMPRDGTTEDFEQVRDEYKRRRTTVEYMPVGGKRERNP